MKDQTAVNWNVHSAGKHGLAFTLIVGSGILIQAHWLSPASPY